MKVNIELILKEVCDYYNLTPKQLFSVTRKKCIVKPRHMFYYISSKHTRLSLDSIGAIAGQYSKRPQDHATVMHARNGVLKDITPTVGFKGYPDTIQQVEELSKLIEYNHLGKIDYQGFLILADKYYSFLNKMDVIYEEVLA